MVVIYLFAKFRKSDSAGLLVIDMKLKVKAESFLERFQSTHLSLHGVIKTWVINDFVEFIKSLFHIWKKKC